MQNELDLNINNIYFTKKQIKQKVKELGNLISKDYAGTKPVILCILKGSFMFTADLVRNISIDHTIEFMSISSYGSQTTSSGNINVELKLRNNIEGKNVIIVEDILETGTTLKYLCEYLNSLKPKSIETVVLLRKPHCVKTGYIPKYIGWDITSEFVVGYGLDYNESYRCLPYIGILKESVYNN